jgi:hypothetical protein
MTRSKHSIVSFDSEKLFERLVAASEALGSGSMDGHELEHLVQVVTRCSALLGNVYTDDRLQAILVSDPRRLTGLVALPFLPGVGQEHLPPALARVRRLPGEAREVGDQALFDLAITGLGSVRGVSLEDLGPRAYRLAADVLELLAADARLRQHFQTGQPIGRSGNIEDEVDFLRRCSDRFSLYARLLREAGDQDDQDDEGEEPASRSMILSPAARTGSSAMVPATRSALTPAADQPAASADATEGRRGRFSEGMGRDHLLAAYERLLLFASLDLESLRGALAETVVDQEEAVSTLIDDFALFGVGTQHLSRPASYFLVGPTGVGKNYLVETLRELFQHQWGLEIPMLTIEGPNYTYPSDINELRGATRGFIRSDEPGLLTEFHERSAKAPVSIILVDEVEKAHAQLRKFFLSILDRGTVTDAQGQELSFAGALIFFTSNIGYKERDATSHPIGFAGEEAANAAYTSELAQSLRRTLSPEFINRVKLVRFRHLPRESARRILELEFEKIAHRYRDLHGIDLELSAAGRETLLDLGYSREYGARHLASVLHRTCNVEIGKMIRRDDDDTGRADPRALIHLVRDIRAGQQPLSMEELEQKVLEQARARVAYRKIVVDAERGQIVYRKHEA